MNEIEMSLLKGLLEMDPNKRYTAYEALMHPYFDGIRDLEDDSFSIKPN